MALELLYAQSETSVKDFLKAKFGAQLDFFEIDTVFVHTMLRVWQKGGSFIGETDVKARNWIISIARNRAFDLLRFGKLANEVEMELDDERVNPGSLQNTIDETSPDLARMLRPLTEMEKGVAERLAIGYKDVDVANELHISRTRVHQIKEQIKNKLKGFRDQTEWEYQ